MGKPHTVSQNKYIKNKYDQVRVVVLKGRKEVIAAYAAEKGMSINGFINGLIDREIGDWQPPKAVDTENKTESGNQ